MLNVGRLVPTGFSITFLPRLRVPVIRWAFIFMISYLGVLAVFSPARLVAQRLFLAGSAGVAVPVLGISDFRSAGPLLTGSVGYDFANPRLSLRADYSWMRFPGEPPPPGGNPSIYYGDMRSRGASLNVMARVLGFPGPAEPYLLFGIGKYDMQIETSEPNRYGWVWGGTYGIGAEFEVGRVRVFAEVPLSIMLSDYGSRDGFVLDSYLPISVGLRFPTQR
jgi:hypothetical protein